MVREEDTSVIFRVVPVPTCCGLTRVRKKAMMNNNFPRYYIFPPQERASEGEYLIPLH